MATATTNFSRNPPLISVRGSEGVFLLAPDGNDYSHLSRYSNFNDEQKNSRISAYDPTGKYFAYCNGLQIKVVDLNNDCNVLCNIDKSRTSYLKFSPQGSFLVTWESFYVTKGDHIEVANLNIYETRTGRLVKSIVQKKQKERFVDWSSDENVYCLQVNSEILFFEKLNHDEPARRIKIENLADFCMHPVSKFVAIFVSGKKSEPSFVRLFKHPNVEMPIANKSFFNADRVEFKWNKTGNNVILHCTTETSQNSYYGDSTLHQITSNGESQLVQLSKKGPVYALEWNPVRDEFIVVYGTMPAKATLFNSKCEPIYDFGTGSRNECYFNQQGNLVCLAGFGNLRGRIEIWHMSSSNKVPQEITTFQADDTTYFEWSPDGEHLLTATTAPRLRVSNGFKVWNYLGELKFTHNMETKCELWQAQWQPGVYPVKVITKKAGAPVVKEETKAYVPPHLRGTNKPVEFKSKLHEDDEVPDKTLKIKSNQPSDDPEKKIKNLRKKLSQIQELKTKQAAGQKLENNQLEKLKSENEIIAELKSLGIN